MMGQSNDPRFHRRSIRLQEYDYSAAGSYFITLVTHQQASLFGEIVDGQMELSREGRIGKDVWNSLQTRYPQLTLERSVVMPNHFHVILTINDKANDEDGMDVRAITHALAGCARGTATGRP